MKKLRKQVHQWIKKHKKELIASGIGITALIAIVVEIKNQDDLSALWDYLKRVAEHPQAQNAVMKTAKEMDNKAIAETVAEYAQEASTASEVAATQVGPFIRNLAEGWHASPEKIAEAEQLGIKLEPGQTYVDKFVRRRAAA